MAPQPTSQGSTQIPAGYPADFGIEWLDRKSFLLKGHRFDIQPDAEALFGGIGGERDGSFYMAKDLSLIQHYLSMFQDEKPKSIVEIGVYRGGSVAFSHLITQAEKILALELAPKRLQKLDNFIAEENLQDSLRVEFGINQSDKDTVRQLVVEHFGEERTVDIVIDDASHMLGPTRNSFEAIFPMIRPGGSYIVEDYAASQMAAGLCLNSDGTPTSDKAVGLFRSIMGTSNPDELQACHVLAVEALLATMSAPGIVQAVTADKNWLRIVRGSEDITAPTTFTLRQLADDHFGLLTCQPDAAVRSLLS